MVGTIDQASDYCKKDAGKEGVVVTEIGRKVQKGSRRTSIDEAMFMHETLDDLMQHEPELYCQFRGGLKDLYAARAPIPDKPLPKVLWFYGATGTGKSREAYRIAEEVGSFWVAPIDLDWFDGYAG